MSVLVSLLGRVTSAQAQEWWVSLAGQSNELIEVTVSTLQVPKGRVLGYVAFSVDFRDSNNTSLGGRQYSFLDGQVPSIVGGQIYTRYFIHGISGASGVIGENLTFDAHSSGGDALTVLNSANKTPPQPATSQVPSTGTYTLTKYDRCQSYAHEAELQNQQNLAEHCGFAGSRWDSRFGYHYNWCLTVSDTAANNESNARAQMLSGCKKR